MKQKGKNQGATNQDRPLRLNRILSLAGLTSRRRADQWILAGRVSVNGRVVREVGTKAFWGRDRIVVDGKEISGPSRRLYLMLNKPFGTICTLSDPQGRPLVTDLLHDINERVYPVGRLDFDTMGLLLLTNDGEWAFRLTHPSYRIPRVYKVTVSGVISPKALRDLSRGVSLEDGPSGPAGITLIEGSGDRSVFRMTITRGKSRQVRRMVETVGLRVVHLIRIGFGSLALGDLKVGRYRHLEPEEVAAMKRLAGLS